MKTTKLFTTIALLGSASLLLTGCTSASSPKTTSSATASPSASITKDGFASNIAIPSGKVISDTAGKYDPVVLNPSTFDLFYKTNKTITTEAKNKFSAAEIKAGTKAAFSFAVSQGLDSIALDDKNAWNTWKKSSATDALWSVSKKDLLADSDGKAPTLLFNQDQQAGGIPQIISNGSPRWTELSADDYTSIGYTSYTDTSTKKAYDVLTVAGEVHGTANATDASIVTAFSALNSSHSKAEVTAELKKDFPQYLDNKGKNVVAFSYAFNYSMVLVDGQWKIAGYQTNPLDNIFGTAPTPTYYSNASK